MDDIVTEHAGSIGLHRRLDLLTKRLLHEPLAGLQRGSRLRCCLVEDAGESHVQELTVMF